MPSSLKNAPKGENIKPFKKIKPNLIQFSFLRTTVQLMTRKRVHDEVIFYKPIVSKDLRMSDNGTGNRELAEKHYTDIKMKTPPEQLSTSVKQ